MKKSNVGFAGFEPARVTNLSSPFAKWRRTTSPSEAFVFTDIGFFGFPTAVGETLIQHLKIYFHLCNHPYFKSRLSSQTDGLVSHINI